MSEETTDDVDGIETRTFETEYVEVATNDETYDISFTITERAETILLRQLGEMLYESADDGIFESHTVHMYKKLCDQNGKFPPWFEMDERTYDVEMNRADYRLFCDLIAMCIEEVVDPDEAGPYFELVDIWKDVTEQVGTTDDANSKSVRQVDRITIDDGTAFKVFRDERAGNSWFQCTECSMSYAEIGDEHNCVDFPDDE